MLVKFLNHINKGNIINVLAEISRASCTTSTAFDVETRRTSTQNAKEDAVSYQVDRVNLFSNAISWGLFLIM